MVATSLENLMGVALSKQPAALVASSWTVCLHRAPHLRCPGTSTSMRAHTPESFRYKVSQSSASSSREAFGLARLFGFSSSSSGSSCPCCCNKEQSLLNVLKSNMDMGRPTQVHRAVSSLRLFHSHFIWPSVPAPRT